jgi:hypothetical protein
MHYILKITPLEGEDRDIVILDARCQPADVYAIIRVADGHAEIVDNGYTTYNEAAKAWPDATGEPHA